MKKVKYQFDRESLSYTKIELSFKDIFFKSIVPKFSISILIGVGIFIVLAFSLESPLKQDLKDQNNQTLLKYSLLTKQLERASDQLADMQKRDDDIYRSIFQASPIPSSMRRAGIGGADRYASLNGFEHSATMVQTAKRLDHISKQLVVQSKSYDEIIDLVKNKEKMMASLPAIKPIANKDLTRFGSAFGWRMHPILGYLKMHSGIDLTAPTGTPIYASGDAVVVRADRAGGYGNHVRLNHGYGYVTVYGHLSKLLLRPGQKVKRGDVIGLVGSTGLSTSPHLHYEVRINGKPVNPLNFYYDDLTDEEFDKMVEMSANANTHIFE